MPWGRGSRGRLKTSMSSSRPGQSTTPGPVKSTPRVEGFPFNSVIAVPPAATRTTLRGSSWPTNSKNSKSREGLILRPRVGMVGPHHLPDAGLVHLDLPDPCGLEHQEGPAQVLALLVLGQGSEKSHELPLDSILLRQEQEQGVVRRILGEDDGDPLNAPRVPLQEHRNHDIFDSDALPFLGRGPEF